MIYFLSIIFILTLILLLYILYGLKDMSSITSKKINIKEISAKEVEQRILIEIAKLEKYLYQKGFVRRDILRVDSKKANVKNYKFYYYNILEGIHGFIEVYKIRDSFAINYFFITIYKSGNYTVSTNFTKESSKNSDGVYINKYNNLTIKELLIMHKVDRQKSGEEISFNKLSLHKLLELPIFIKSLRVKKRNNLPQKRLFKEFNFKWFKNYKSIKLVGS